MKTIHEHAERVNQASRVKQVNRPMRAALSPGVLTASLVGILALAAPAWGRPEGIAGYAGAPGERQTCTECHDEPMQVDGTFIVSLPAEEIVVDELVPIDLYFIGDMLGRWGFNLIAIDTATGSPVGEFEDGPGSRFFTSDDTGWEYLSHTFPGTTNEIDGDPGWMVGWWAPPYEVESVRFYATFLAANGDLDDEGDTVFQDQVVVSVIPEPGALSAVAASLFTLAALRRRRA